MLGVGAIFCDLWYNCRHEDESEKSSCDVVRRCRLGGAVGCGSGNVRGRRRTAIRIRMGEPKRRRVSAAVPDGDGGRLASRDGERGGDAHHGDGPCSVREVRGALALSRDGQGSCGASAPGPSGPRFWRIRHGDAVDIRQQHLGQGSLRQQGADTERGRPRRFRRCRRCAICAFAWARAPSRVVSAGGGGDERRWRDRRCAGRAFIHRVHGDGRHDRQGPGVHDGIA